MLHLPRRWLKTQIVIEQCNGQTKDATNCFDSKIKICQIGLADRIFHSSFLLQNFKLPFIQERYIDSPLTDGPCVAEVCWYGATDNVLVDMRTKVELCNLESENERWHELHNMDENQKLTNNEVSEIVLEEYLPSKLYKLHIEKIQYNLS